MNSTEPPNSLNSESERSAVAELLGRILAAYWLANRRPANELPLCLDSAESPLTASTTETYDGR